MAKQRQKGKKGGAFGGRKKNKKRTDRLDDDLTKFAGISGLSTEFKRNRLKREERDEAILQRKQKSNYKGKMKARDISRLNDMTDLNQGDFASVNDMMMESMVMGAKRPGRRSRMNGNNHMYNEVRYTSMHRDEMMKSVARKSPIEFVKAKDNYDPSKHLLDKLVKDRQEPNVQEIIVEGEEGEEEEEGEEDKEGSQKHQKEIIPEFECITGRIEAVEEHAEEKKEEDDNNAEEDENEENEDEEDENEENEDEENEDEEDEDEEDEDEEDEDEEEANDLFFSKDTELSSKVEQPTIMFSKLNVKENSKQQLIFVDDNLSEEFELSIDNDESDSNESDKPTEYVEPAFLVFDDENGSDSDSSSMDLKIGKYLGRMKTDKLVNHYIDLPFGKKAYKQFAPPAKEHTVYDFDLENDRLTVQEVENHVNLKMAGEKKKAFATVSETAEFGFNEEDYVSFDVTNITIENIRAGGNSNSVQYYIKAPFLFGSDDYQWLSKEDFSEFLVANGLPEHRIDPFLKFASKNISNPYDEDSSENEIYFDEDQEFMDSSSDEDLDLENRTGFISLNSRDHKNMKNKKQIFQDDEDDGDDSSELDNDLMEGMEDLLSMHKNAMNFGRSADPLEVKTKAIRAKGKRNKNKDTFELEFNENFDIDPTLRAYMEDNYLKRKENKKEKKFEREEARKNDCYLLNKYPYCIEMEEAIDEMKEFHKDAKVEVLRFPPLDYNAHMVLKMAAAAFCFPCKKMGKGKKEYLQIRKSVNKAKKKEPDWIQIDKLRKKRNLCFRMDINLSKEEKLLFKKVKGGKTSKGISKVKGGGNFGYKEGEIVGDGARAISNESIGRKLLEKMGWQNGEALGVEGNKGIIEPIQVVVKTTKRGIM